MKTGICTVNELAPLVEMGKKFCEESKWGWTYSEDNALNTFYNAIMHPECDVIYIKNDDDVMIGAAMVAYETDFQVERVGDILEFYMLSSARGTGASRELLEAVCDWFDEKGCVNVFVKSTANIGQAQAFNNLFAKYGFKVFSQVLVR